MHVCNISFCDETQQFQNVLRILAGRKTPTNKQTKIAYNCQSKKKLRTGHQSAHTDGGRMDILIPLCRLNFVHADIIMKFYMVV